jgi:hypothetical protein
MAKGCILYNVTPPPNPLNLTEAYKSHVKNLRVANKRAKRKQTLYTKPEELSKIIHDDSIIYHISKEAMCIDKLNVEDQTLKHLLDNKGIYLRDVGQ